MKHIRYIQPLQQQGQVLVTILLVIPFFMLMVMAYLNLASSNFRLAKSDQLHTAAQLAADAGADDAIEQINQNSAWTGTGGEVTLHNGASTKTTYTVSVASSGSSSKTLTVTGKAYWPVNATTAGESVTLSVDLRPVTSGNYSVVSGEGGLYMSNNSKIAGGDVLINGQINLSNSAQIGLSTNPVNVSVADQVCPNPPDSTYPQICGSGGTQPITISSPAHIYGTVKANNQTSGSGMSNPGLSASSGVLAQPLPTYDRAGQEAAVTTTINGDFNCSSGSQTWQANTKIVGNVNISNRCQVTANGNVWITGNFNISNSAELIVAGALGSTRPVIMIDGSSGATFSNGADLVPNSTGTGFEVITFWSTASCSPECSSVTGTDLYNSRGHTTISLSNSSTAANTVFYSHWTQVQMSNSGQVGALIGETIQMSNAATVTFSTSTGGTGPTFWVADGYRRIYP